MRRLSRHPRRPRPASIAATVAFFLAVGGAGYAVTGSGTLQKENEIGLETADVEIIRTIAGVGDVRTTCSGGNPTVKIHNASGEQLKLRLDKGDELFWTDSLDNGEDHDPGFITADEIFHYHVSPTDGTKSPQADITVSVDHTGDCNTTQVAVLNVTTSSSGTGTVEGSGTVQKASSTGFTSEFETVRTIKGVGRIDARCEGDSATGLLFVNTSGETVRSFREIERSTGDGSFAPGELADGAGAGFSQGDAELVVRYHVFPSNGTKRPQADIVVSVDDTDDCATNQVSVLSVTTEQ